MELEKMSNEEFTEMVSAHLLPLKTGIAEAIKAEILKRLDNPTEYKNCGNCGWANEDRGVCGNPISDTLEEFIYDSTLCKEHKEKDNGTEMNALREQFKQKSGIDLSDTETVGKFPYYNNNKWGSISRGEGWKRFAEFLESKPQPLTPEAVREEAEKRYPFATSNDHNERLTNYVHKEMQNIFIEGATFASIPRFKEQEIRLLTAMVIEMKNEISQTVRHCQAQAIINKLKDEHTL